MKTYLLTAAAVSFALATASIASAQSYAVEASGYQWGPRAHYHASTYEEGVLRGQADVIRSWGSYNYYSSLAAVNLEEARSRYIQNREKATKTYFEMRRVNAQARAAERPERLTAQQLTKIAKQRAPQRLAAHQFNPATGELFWPAVLHEPQYASLRTEIDLLMSTRSPGAPSDGTSRQITQAAEKLLDQLRSNIATYPTTDYLQAKKFLVSVKREMQFPASPAGLAMN